MITDAILSNLDEASDVPSDPANIDIWLDHSRRIVSTLAGFRVYDGSWLRPWMTYCASPILNSVARHVDFSGSAEDQTPPVMSLKSLCDRPALVKMDIEGGEFEVLEGGLPENVGRAGRSCSRKLDPNFKRHSRVEHVGFTALSEARLQHRLQSGDHSSMEAKKAR